MGALKLSYYENNISVNGSDYSLLKVVAKDGVIITQSSNYYTFGSPINGRSVNAGTTYAYGFNGKENDNEIKGDGNSVDFDARMLDTRLGRWMSVDKSTKLQPGWSPYKSFLDNPISYQDPDGRTEFETITVNDQSTGKSITITRVISSDVFKSSSQIVYDAFDMPVNVETWSDKIHHTTYTIDKKGNVSVAKKDEFGDKRTTTSGPFRDFHFYAKIFVSASSWDESLEGNGGSQNGGFVFTSDDGGASPTKQTSNSYAEQRNIGNLLTVLGALGSGNASLLGKASMGTGFADKVKDLSQIIQDAKDVKDNFSKKSPNKDKYCTDCNRTFDKNGKVVEDNGKTPKDTVDLNGHD